MSFTMLHDCSLFPWKMGYSLVFSHIVFLSLQAACTLSCCLSWEHLSMSLLL